MADPLIIRFGADTSGAQSAMASLAASVAGNMASAGVALSGMAANSNSTGNALGALQQNVTRAATAVSNDLRNISSRTAAAATADKATLEGVVRAFTASAVASETAGAAARAGLTGTTTAVSTIVAQIPSLRTLLGAFLAFEAAKLVFESVSASIEAARKHIEEFVKIGRDAERAGIGAESFQRATLGAEKYGLTVDQVTQALNKAREASEIRIGEGKGGTNASAIDGRLAQNVRAGNLTAADKAAFDGAGGQEAKIRVMLDLIERLRAASRDAAAFDLAGKFFGPDFERQLRNGIDLTGQLRAALDSTSATVAGVRIVGEDEVERARLLDAKAKDIADTFASALAPVQRDISNSVLNTYEAFLDVEAVIARVLGIAVNLYTQIAGVVTAAKEFVNQIPGIGKVLTAGNPLTLLQEAGRAVGLIDQEVQGPTAPLAVRVRPRGRDRSAVLPSLPSRGGGGGDSDRLDAVENLISQIEKARDTAKAELENVAKTNVERERAVALAKAEAAAREEVKKGNRDSAELTEGERTRVLAAAEAWQTYKDRTMDAQQAIRQAADAARYFGEAASGAFADAILEGRSFSDILNTLSQQIFRSGLQAAFTGQGPLAGLLGTAPSASSGDTVGGIAGLLTSLFRANGGPVDAGRAYTVGERGRELFIPNQNGQIVPIARGDGAAGGGRPSIRMGDTIIDARGADAGVEQRLRALVTASNAENRRLFGQQFADWQLDN